MLQVVRTVTDTSIIPHIAMQLRLHTRSGYCNQMARKASFKAVFRSFTFEPISAPVPPPPGVRDGSGSSSGSGLLDLDLLVLFIAS